MGLQKAREEAAEIYNPKKEAADIKLLLQKLKGELGDNTKVIKLGEKLNKLLLYYEERLKKAEE
jgi:hypothetical protein